MWVRVPSRVTPDQCAFECASGSTRICNDRWQTKTQRIKAHGFPTHRIHLDTVAKSRGGPPTAGRRVRPAVASVLWDVLLVVGMWGRHCSVISVAAVWGLSICCPVGEWGVADRRSQVGRCLSTLRGAAGFLSFALRNQRQFARVAKGVDQGSTSESCVGSNPTAVIPLRPTQLKAMGARGDGLSWWCTVVVCVCVYARV